MVYTWTDDPLQDGTEPSPTKIRGIHVRELRTNADLELVKRSLGAKAWEDTITDSITKSRKDHIDELRQAIQDANNVVPIYCNTNTPFNVNWSETITANTTAIRKIHIEELRQYTDQLNGNCYCDCNGPCNSYTPPCSHSPGCCHGCGGR